VIVVRVTAVLVSDVTVPVVLDTSVCVMLVAVPEV